MSKLIASLALITGLSLSIPAVADVPNDPVHALIQKFLYAVQDGADFRKTDFKETVTAETAEKLVKLQYCELRGVRRSQGDEMALISWDCAKSSGPKQVTVMITLESVKIKTIEVVHFMEVNTKP